MTHTPTPKTTEKPCGCHGAPSQPCAPDDATPPYAEDCCDLVCFERPNYFSGHLLTADDLAAAQRYTIEKNKLRNRALHGSGVVCGLRLTCHPECRGYICIGEGYALDDCGHDIVVCAPARFDVPGALREKYCAPPASADPCVPPRKPPADAECRDEQCYRVVICYRERQKNFVTPFSANGCSDGPRECEATRVSETCVIELLTDEELAHKKSTAEKWEALAKKSCTLFEPGPFLDALRSGQVQAALTFKDDVEREDYQEALTKLRRAFRQHLDHHPEHYRCGLKREIDDLALPPYDRDFLPKTRDVFQKLLDAAWTHFHASTHGDLIFDCTEPCRGGCVVLGSVVIADGRLVNVCNTPREYVWTPVNFLQVAAFYLNAKKDTPGGDDAARKCCPSWEFPTGEYAAPPADKTPDSPEAPIKYSTELLERLRTQLREAWIASLRGEAEGTAVSAATAEGSPVTAAEIEELRQQLEAVKTELGELKKAKP